MTDADSPRSHESPADELLEFAWAIIANAGFGDWSKESEDWQAAAPRWREKYFAYLDALNAD